MVFLVIVLIAVLWEFEFMHVPRWGPAGIALYFIIFLAFVILVVGVTEHRQQVLTQERIGVALIFDPKVKRNEKYRYWLQQLCA